MDTRGVGLKVQPPNWHSTLSAVLTRARHMESHEGGADSWESYRVIFINTHLKMHIYFKTFVNDKTHLQNSLSFKSSLHITKTGVPN